ncbi:MAG: hypothetical protein LZF61_10880 [Nitrosomonas sp.]|nr:MAG: hypothetical protein LZF61_10880 [Nitrosomonas sp.]
MRELSGLIWVRRFPGSNKTADLTPTFKTNVESFLIALRTAGANIHISATFRPPERAYLMHYAWEIARNGVNPATVPGMPGVDIEWAHKLSNGTIDLVKSKQAAEEMIGSSGYNMVQRAALKGRHMEGRAIDMNITWNESLIIKQKDGSELTIDTKPRDGTNISLHSVGAGYGVIKLLSDPPHWSDDGH